ncbi:unnamed protein product [Didymodactylos carnosus]|uniref:Gamma-tubulin complex component n=1 Tax=Didymodactylos carnosus TaxID=1234261 RepID=A0A815HYB3_9BILA|nr:unnamed protein product [Didymodactylos carnosus]CAF4238200.1 unnamed protein product [Didymodactylos carnosus]
MDIHGHSGTDLFNIGKEWFSGLRLISNPLKSNSDVNDLFLVKRNESVINHNTSEQNYSNLSQVEHLYEYTKQLKEKPCLPDDYFSHQPIINTSSQHREHSNILHCLPSQTTLYDLCQISTTNDQTQDGCFKALNYEDSISDDGFQSASSGLTSPTNSFEKASVVSKKQEDDESNEKNKNVINIWNKALINNQNEYYTWENRGSHSFRCTLPYLFDIRDNSFTKFCWFLLSQDSSICMNENNIIQFRSISLCEFLRDLCYLLLNVPSSSFSWQETDQTFMFNSEVVVDGYTREAIRIFALKYVTAGNKFCIIYNYVNDEKNDIHSCETEIQFRRALRYYLRFIQNTIVIHEMSKFSLIQFSSHIDTIICTVDLPVSLIVDIKNLEKLIQTNCPTTSLAFIKLSSILHTLLTHRHHTVNNNHFLLLLHFVTYSLRPLIKFFQQLILYSVHDDRYNEFPIVFNQDRRNGLKTNDFWTKTFMIRYLHSTNQINRDILHQILSFDLLQQIVNITRSLTLIRLCDKHHPLCSDDNFYPSLKFVCAYNEIDRKDIEQYKIYMNEKIDRHEQNRRDFRLQIEEAKRQELLERYAVVDKRREVMQDMMDNQQKKDIEKRRKIRQQLEEQIEDKERQKKEEKIADTAARQNPDTNITTVIGSQLPSQYSNLVDSVRQELITTYDKKTRIVDEREQLAKLRVQQHKGEDTIKVSKTVTENKHIPSQIVDTNVDNEIIIRKHEISPIESLVETDSGIETLNTTITVDEEGNDTLDLTTSITTPSKNHLDNLSKNKPSSNSSNVNDILHTKQVMGYHVSHESSSSTMDRQSEKQNEITVYRPSVRIVPSNVLKSTVQNYMKRNIESVNDDNLVVEDEQKVYDWDEVIAAGPRFHYSDSFSINNQLEVSTASNVRDVEMDGIMPLKVWLDQSLSPIIHLQSQLVNRALLNYFQDELQLHQHLGNLRTYYFLAKGRFGQAFCQELSRQLLLTDDVRSVYKVSSLRHCLYSSLDQAGELNNLDILRLVIKPDIPNSLDSSLLDYFDLIYVVKWPMNIIVTDDMIEKYKSIFRFLLRILLIKQVLNEIWVTLKSGN